MITEDKITEIFCLADDAGSTGKCKISDLSEELIFRVRKIEFLPRSEIQFLRYVFDISVREVVEIGFFRYILSD